MDTIYCKYSIKHNIELVPLNLTWCLVEGMLDYSALRVGEILLQLVHFGKTKKDVER
jgi:hypothetical protein